MEAIIEKKEESEPQWNYKTMLSEEKHTGKFGEETPVRLFAESRNNARGLKDESAFLRLLVEVGIPRVLKSEMGLERWKDCWSDALRVLDGVCTTKYSGMGGFLKGERVSSLSKSKFMSCSLSGDVNDRVSSACVRLLFSSGCKSGIEALKLTSPLIKIALPTELLPSNKNQ